MHQEVKDELRIRLAVIVAGQILVHQAPPTAKGHHFITLEDEDGFINIIVRPTSTRSIAACCASRRYWSSTVRSSAVAVC